MLSELRTLYRAEKDGELEALITDCFRKLLQMLNTIAGIPDEQLTECMEYCRSLYQMTGKPAFQELRQPLMEAFERLLEQKNIRSGLEGSVLGLLYGHDSAYEQRIAHTAAGYIRGTKEMLSKSTAFLRGLFFTARDYVFVSGDFLKLIDELLERLPDEEFLRLLPELRMAFGYFTPLETDRIAGQAAALHGKSKENFFTAEKFCQAFTLTENGWTP